MRRGLMCIVLIVLLAISVLSGCQQEPDITENKPYDSAYYDASRFYLEYMDSSMHDASQAAQFCYFEDDSAKQLYLQSAQKSPTTSYEIIRFEKLSDNLWVVETCIVSGMFPNGIYGVNYVGVVDDNMLVYRNLRELPAVLTEGLEIEEYEIHGPVIVK